MTPRKRTNATSESPEAETAKTKRAEADRRDTAEAETPAPVKRTTAGRRRKTDREAVEVKRRPRVRTADTGDASLGWTVQSGIIKPEDDPQEPGVVIRPEQLPDPVEQRTVNVDPYEWASNGTVYVDHGDGTPTPYVP